MYITRVDTHGPRLPLYLKRSRLFWRRVQLVLFSPSATYSLPQRFSADFRRSQNQPGESYIAARSLSGPSPTATSNPRRYPAIPPQVRVGIRPRLPACSTALASGVLKLVGRNGSRAGGRTVHETAPLATREKTRRRMIPQCSECSTIALITYRLISVYSVRWPNVPPRLRGVEQELLPRARTAQVLSHRLHVRERKVSGGLDRVLEMTRLNLCQTRATRCVGI